MTTETPTAMRFSVEPLGPCRKRIKVTIPPQLVTEEFDKSYRQWARSVPIPGFRPGKAPRKLVEKRFGKQVAGEVKQSLLDNAYTEAIKENKLSPIADPEVDLEKVSVEPPTRRRRSPGQPSPVARRGWAGSRSRRSPSTTVPSRGTTSGRTCPLAAKWWCGIRG